MPATIPRTIQAWMGHKNIQHTVRYTELAPDRFKGLPERMRVDLPFSLSGRQFYRLDQLRIIRIRFRAIDPLRHRPALQEVVWNWL
jgi:hypothetical protein